MLVPSSDQSFWSGPAETTSTPGATTVGFALEKKRDLEPIVWRAVALDRSYRYESLG